jgi:hypothetical protein
MAAMVVLLLMFDEPRRRRLADDCRAVSSDVQCIESGDDVGAVLALAPERIDLVVLDAALLRRPGAAHLVNWWRSVPWGELVILDEEEDTDFEVSRPAVLRVLS